MIEECDAGLIKIVVPIFVGDEFVGAAGGCGLLMAEDGEVDDFMIHKTTEMPETRIAALAEGIGTITASQVKSLSEFIRDEVQRAVDKVRPA